MIRQPTPATLKRYGLTVDEWRALLAAQNGVCYVCRKEPSSGTLCIDHDHAPKWKTRPPEVRKTYVRGLLCWFCNKHYVGRAITIAKAKRVVEYLEAYERKQAKGE